MHFWTKVYKLITIFTVSDKKQEMKKRKMSEPNNINSSILIKPLTCRVFTSINHFYIFWGCKRYVCSGSLGGGAAAAGDCCSKNYTRVVWCFCLSHKSSVFANQTHARMHLRKASVYPAVLCYNTVYYTTQASRSRTRLSPSCVFL